MVISRSLKFGRGRGEGRVKTNVWGGVNICKWQIYIEEHFKKTEKITLSWGGRGCRFSTGGSRGGG